MKREERHDQKRIEILQLLSQYKDEHRNVDLTKFREEQGSAYTRINYYFGSVEGALQALQAEATGTSTQGRGAPTSKLTLRNELAYDMLVELRKTMTLDEIGKKYNGVSRAHVNQLYQSLDMSVGAKRKEAHVETTKF